MMTPTYNNREIHDMLASMPFNDRLAAIVVAIVLDDPNAATAAASLISIARMMGKRLSPAERQALVWHMQGEAEELAATWN